MDEGTCMVDLAKFFMDFIQRESCGKCIPCREGTLRMLEILTRITQGRRSESGADALDRFRGVIVHESPCGGHSGHEPVRLGPDGAQSRPQAPCDGSGTSTRPTSSAGTVPAGVCTELRMFTIEPESCNRVRPVPQEVPRRTPSSGPPSKCTTSLKTAASVAGPCVDVCPKDAVRLKEPERAAGLAVAENA